jgi:hypothetical protein
VRFSQSTLDKADNCLLSFQYTIEDDTYFDGIVRAVGTAYHAGLEQFYGARIARAEGRPSWDRPVELDEVIAVARDSIRNAVANADEFAWDEKFPDEEAARACVSGMLTHYFTVELEDGPIPWSADDWEVLGVEVPWELPHPAPLSDELLLTSRGIDLVLRHRESGWIVGVDHKTTGRGWDAHKHDPRKKAQGPLYVWAMQNLYPDAPGYKFVYDIMSYPTKKAGKNPAGWCNFDRREADPQPEHIEAALARVAKAAWLYEKVRGAGMDLPPNPTSTLCSERYCDYFSICPFGKALSHLPE